MHKIQLYLRNALYRKVFFYDCFTSSVQIRSSQFSSYEPNLYCGSVSHFRFGLSPLMIASASHLEEIFSSVFAYGREINIVRDEELVQLCYRIP